MKTLFALLFLTLLGSCASKPYNYPLDKRFNKDEPITLQATVNLAYASYLTACVDIFRLGGQEKVYEDCSSRAKKYVNENVIEVLKQDGTGD